MIETTRKGDMLYRKLGRTQENVSIIGLGGFHIGMARSEAESVQLIRTAIDSGITFMDNCWDYHEGISEMWMGQALKDGYRDKVFLSTAVLGMKPMGAGRILGTGLVDAMECLHYVMNLPVSVVITGMERMDLLDQALEAVRTFGPLSEGEISELLGRTEMAARNGTYEGFKTSTLFDATARHPEWLGTVRTDPP